MGYLDWYKPIRPGTRMYDAKKKIYVSENYPEDGQFWILEKDQWVKYKKLKPGWWSKTDVFGNGLFDKLSPAYMDYKEFLEINNNLVKYSDI